MGILSSLYTGVSGMSAQGEALSVVSDNIANSNTTGFKASRAEFQDVLSSNLKNLLGGNQVGRGVQISSVTPVLAQGNVDATEKATDLAISGDGMFVLKGSDGVSYTRDGSFHFDREGYLCSADDQRVQGFEATDAGKITNKVSDVHFPRTLIPAKATENLNMELNLDSRLDVVGKPFDVKDPHGTSQYSTGVEVYDSQGNKHLMTMFFSKTADRTWDVHGLCDGKEVTGGKPGEFSEVYQAKITFTTDGKLDTQTMTKSAFNFSGGALQNQAVKVSFGDSITTDKGKGLIGTKQFGKNSDLISWKQDGSEAGTIISLTFDDSGVLTGVYSNGETRDLAQVALAKFENTEQLNKVGANRLKETRNSGTASVGHAGASGRGRIFAKSLEHSTVDLAHEFVNLIQNQRGFQANAKTITTTDELLNEVIQLKR
jgi:flagellar hook protein FlgE